MDENKPDNEISTKCDCGSGKLSEQCCKVQNACSCGSGKAASSCCAVSDPEDK